MGSCNSTAIETSNSKLRANIKKNKRIFQSKRLRNLKENIENKFSKNHLLPFPLVPNTTNEKTNIKIDSNVDLKCKESYNSNENSLDLEHYDNTSLVHLQFIDHKRVSQAWSNDQFPLIDRDSIVNIDSYEIVTEISVSMSQNTSTTVHQMANLGSSSISTNLNNQQRPPASAPITRFGFKPVVSNASLSNSSIPQVPQASSLSKTSQNLLQTNDPSLQKNTQLLPTKTMSSSNSNPQLKKFTELNIQLSTSESSSLSSASSSSSSNSNSTSSSSSSNKQFNTKSFSPPASSPSTNTSVDLDVLIDQQEVEVVDKKIPGQSQFISFLKNPITTLSSLNNAYQNKNSNNANIKSQPSIPTLLRYKPPTNIQSNSYASLSSTSTSSVKINENETIPAQTGQNSMSKTQSKLLQPKKQNQILNSNKSKKNSPIRKQTNENLSSDSNIKLNETNNSTNFSELHESQTKTKDSQSNHSNLNNKRRLFSPYSLNSNSNTENSSVTSSTYSNSVNSRDSSESRTISPQKTQQSLKQPTSFKLFSQLSGLKQNNSNTGNNIISNNNSESKLKYFSKMPLKANHLKQNTELKQSNESCLSKKIVTNDQSTSSLSKKEDSAYSSSTSSTVSSQEAESRISLLSNEFKNSNKTNPLDSSSTDNFSSTKNTNHEKSIVTLENENGENKNSTNENDLKISTGVEFTEETYLNVTQEFKQSIVDLETDNSRISKDGDSISLTTNKEQSSHSRLLKSSHNKIQDSLGELNNLMMTSSSSIASSIPVTNEESALKNSNSLKHRKSSMFSMNQSTNGQHVSPMFKPPSQLPPVENGEVIQLDIETYRFLMQDLQSTKAILYKVANMLREPTTECVFDSPQSEDFQNAIISNPLISSLYNHQIGSNFTTDNNFIDRQDQATQTDNSF